MAFRKRAAEWPPFFCALAKCLAEVNWMAKGAMKRRSVMECCAVRSFGTGKMRSTSSGSGAQRRSPRRSRETRLRLAKREASRLARGSRSD